MLGDSDPYTEEISTLSDLLAAVTTVSAVLSEQSFGLITVSWSEVEDAISYRINVYRGANVLGAATAAVSVEHN